MGCVASQSKISNKSVLASSMPGTLSKAFERSSIHNPTSKPGLKRLSINTRGVTLNPRRHSLSPAELGDFWGTMPLPVVIDRFKLFYEEIKKGNGEVSESVEYIQTILTDISDNFSDSKFRVIKKNDSKFKSLIGKYPSGLQFFRYISFKELEDSVQVHDNLDGSNVKNIIKAFEIAFKRVDEMKAGRNSIV
jgi:hypothetical protein